MSKCSIVIMAAGLGTRMKSKTPKVLHSISGHPMLFHILWQAKLLSDDIHIVLYHEHEKIKQTLKPHFSNLNFHIQDFKNHPGTGGAIMGIEPKYEYTLVLSGDMPLVTSEGLKTLLNSNSTITMSTFNAENPKGYGRVVTNKKNQVSYIVEEKDATLDEKKIDLVNAGVYLFKNDFLNKYTSYLRNDNAQAEYYLTDLIEIAIKNKFSVSSILVDEEEFMGINSKYQLAQAETYMQNRIKNRWMEKGVSMRLSETIFIDALASFEGECMIENGVTIAGKTKIKDSTIKTNSVIESSFIENSTIGPLAHIRPKCNIINSGIGNFVEVKNSNLNGTKAGHLSYLGDSNIKKGTNIGCGTITCNYDGKAKHITNIGENVFIGSGTQIVAPIEIEDDVIIGAGSTITKNIPKDALALTRAPLKIVDGFFSRFFNKKDSK